jgi:hypothetical protein
MHVACSSDSTMPDAATADASTGGLTIELVAKGGVPQMPQATVEITRLVIGMKTIRAIGDAAPGDMRTTRTDLELEWRDNLMPVPHLFPMAPPGVYSTVELRVGDSTKSAAAIDIVGRATRGGNLVPFEIESQTSEVPISIAVSTVLTPRTIATTTIEVDVAALVEDIVWDSVPLTTEGRLYIGDGDPGMASVVSEIATAFASAN